MTVLQTDVMVLGAGVVGVATALQLRKRPNTTVVLIDKNEPGMQTSYGNAGVIESDTLFPPAFPFSVCKLAQVALKRATEANYHWSFLPKVAPWLLSFAEYSRLGKLIETTTVMRPLFKIALEEHKLLMSESNALRYLNEKGWLKVNRTEAGFHAGKRERDLAREYGLDIEVLSPDQAIELEPNLRKCFTRAVHWKTSANVTNPLGVTKAYFERYLQIGGSFIRADARSLKRHQMKGEEWGVWALRCGETTHIAQHVVVALGPWSQEFLDPYGIKLPLGYKRGYHRHYKTSEKCSLQRPVMDAEKGYYMASMEQGLRLTTGAEFADRDAPQTPVQFDRILPFAKELLPLGEQVTETWMGTRPCFADSRPVIGPAPGQKNMWLAYGHAHWGLTLAAVTGRLLGEMIGKEKPFCDPAPYRADRFM